MAQKDYVSKRLNKRKKQSGKGRRSGGAMLRVITFAVCILLILIAGIHFVMKHREEAAIKRATREEVMKEQHEKNLFSLPEKPQERWRYIKALENSDVVLPVETEKKQPSQNAEEERVKALLEGNPSTPPPSRQKQSTFTDRLSASASTSQAPASGTSSLNPPATTASASTSSSYVEKTDPASWLLQCGIFKNKQNAEEVKATLALNGVEAHITVVRYQEYRVVVGPFASRSQANGKKKKLDELKPAFCIVVASRG